jgi:hypothetical protein
MFAQNLIFPYLKTKKSSSSRRIIKVLYISSARVKVLKSNAWACTEKKNDELVTGAKYYPDLIANYSKY